jgi:MFS transporter, PAT family, beta-lactamase induction signal transducer AmpG
VAQSTDPPPRPLLPWLASVAFLSGVPFALVTDTAPLLYRKGGVDLSTVGFFSGVVLGWPLKVFLAPLVDRFGERRRWIAAAALGIACLLALASQLPGDQLGFGAFVLFLLVALAGGLLDTAVDGYAVDATPRERTGPAAGTRTAAYRIALVVAGGWLVARAPALGWSGTWLAASLLVATLALVALALPAAARTPSPRVELGPALAPLLARPAVVAFLAFVLLYKVGDRAMAPLTKVFLQDRGFTPSELGDVLTPLQILATMLGAVLGGLLTRRWGVIRALLLLGLAQALSNLGYAQAAYGGDRATAWAAAVVEPFCGGLGTAPFVTLFMLACERAHAATQYAFLTALMGLVGGAIGIPGGALVEDAGLGYAGYFLVTGLIALPPLLLLPGVRRWLAGRTAS